MSVCRSCGQTIEWVKLVSGKNQPVDPEYLEYEEADVGTVLVTDGGNVIKVSANQNMPNVRGRISHFATCPDAGKWRKSK